MGIVAGWGRLSEGGQLPSILQYVSTYSLITSNTEIGKNERERRSFAFSSVQFMNLAHIFYP